MTKNQTLLHIIYLFIRQVPVKYIYKSRLHVCGCLQAGKTCKRADAS